MKIIGLLVVAIASYAINQSFLGFDESSALFGSMCGVGAYLLLVMESRHD